MGKSTPVLKAELLISFPVLIWIISLPKCAVKPLAIAMGI
jgi:hypothetical protein